MQKFLKNHGSTVITKLTCPRCKTVVDVTLAAFVIANNLQDGLWCADCWNKSKVKVVLLDPPCLTSDEAESGGRADIFRAQVFCIGCGTLRNVINNIVEPCPHCGNARKKVELKWLSA